MNRLFLMYCLIVLLLPLTALAGIQFDGTRVIYPAGKREVTLGLTNKASTPRLIQAWIDSGDADIPPSQIKVPFIVFPPIFRLDAGKGQTLRIVYTGGAIPHDRESVFWLNVLEVQPKRAASQTTANALKVSVRIRLKLFYRPQGLSGSPETAANLLRWRLVAEGKRYHLECENPGDYNVSFNHVGFKGTPDKEEGKQSGMCPAKSKTRFAITGSPATAGGRLELTVIDDFGGYHHSEAGFER